jgi:hypothetical protein
MSRAWWLNVLLAAAVAALGLFVYVKPGGQIPADHALSTLKPREISSIRIERTGTAPILLKKEHDAWLITAPLAARADTVRVQNLLAVAEATSAIRLSAIDLARFELETPQARLTLGSQRFDFGMANPVSREQYVLTGDAVYAISPRYGTVVPASAGELVDKRLFGGAEVPLRIELGEFTVARLGGKWTLDPPAGELSQDDYQRWVDDWRNASAVRVAPYVHVKGKPLGEIGLQFQSGGKLTLAILAREPELALLRPDENLVYYFLSGHAQRLLAAPGAAAEANSKTLDAKQQSR